MGNLCRQSNSLAGETVEDVMHKNRIAGSTHHEKGGQFRDQHASAACQMETSKWAY